MIPCTELAAAAAGMELRLSAAACCAEMDMQLQKSGMEEVVISYYLLFIKYLPTATILPTLDLCTCTLLRYYFSIIHTWLAT